ncbi:2-keto-3-deoxygluconate permease [Geomicrobium sediminis]|uniref:2-keto-3-deoxygluconate permease n=1 Tax=Geomicrobium sediminis TaxID=1347788 RepID=A0ABS2PAH8_9BACL|nr:2-keto-3-deoxygluconate permease [Geomicrobium sediminis]MBM7632309.1 2-keto-3-deoxygluconate permease [Geomicrobium sediminis]
MQIKKTIEKVPGGLMVIPLLLGATLNTVDQLQIPWIVDFLQMLGAEQQENGNYEFLRLGGFSEWLFKDGAMVLIALFLFCCGSQMNLKIGGKALKIGTLLLVAKYGSGVAVGFAFASIFGVMDGLLGLSLMTIVAAMTNGNGGMYAALTSQYGRRSDVGGVAVLSLNDGPFLTMVALGVIGTSFPFIAFVAVLLPILIGMILGNLDEDIREFLKPGEILPVPFFAFALGAGMNLALFFNPEVVGAGILLGVLTTVVTGFAGMLIFKLFKERSYIAPWAEASTAGNATATPMAIAAAASSSGAAMSASQVQAYQDLVPLATAQISLAVIVTALLCPVAVIIVDRWQRKRGIDGRLEDDEMDELDANKNGKEAS